LAGVTRATHGRIDIRTWTVLAALVLAVLWSGIGRTAEESPDIQALLRRLDSVNADIEDALASMVDRYPYATPGNGIAYDSRVLSIQKNAEVTIGGDFRVNYTFANSNLVDQRVYDPFVKSCLSRSSLGDLALTKEKLFIDAKVGRRWHGYIEMNLNSSGNSRTIYETTNPNGPGRPGQAIYPARRLESAINDNLGEAYVELLKDGHSGFGFKAGLIDLDWGVSAKPDLFLQSYLANPDLNGSYLMNPVGTTQSPRLPHASKLAVPVMALQASYEMRDIIRFEVAAFKDAHLPEDSVLIDSGGTYVSRDPGFRSWQVGASILPLEDWELSVAFRNRYNKGRGISYWANSPFRSDFRSNLAGSSRDPVWNGSEWTDSGSGQSFGSRKNEQALVVGLALEIPNTKLSVFAEYAKGWNQGFNDHIDSDNVNVGFAYRLLPRLTLHAQGEWLYVKDRSWLVSDGANGWVRDVRMNRITRAMFAAEYELMSGLTLEAGWQCENWHFKSSYTPSRKTLRSDLFYVGSRFIF